MYVLSKSMYVKLCIQDLGNEKYINDLQTNNNRKPHFKVNISNDGICGSLFHKVSLDKICFGNFYQRN